MNEETYKQSLQTLANKLGAAELVSAQYQALYGQADKERSELTATLVKINAVLESDADLKSRFDEAELKLHQKQMEAEKGEEL